MEVVRVSAQLSTATFAREDPRLIRMSAPRFAATESSSDHVHLQATATTGTLEMVTAVVPLAKQKPGSLAQEVTSTDLTSALKSAATG